MAGIAYGEDRTTLVGFSDYSVLNETFYKSKILKTPVRLIMAYGCLLIRLVF